MENYVWKIGNFATGEIINNLPLYVVGDPEIDISVDNDDTATISVLLTPYSDTIKNSWTSYFKEVLHFCVAIGESSGDVLWAGMINKITPSISQNQLELQLVNPKEYTSARIVGEKFGDIVEDPTAGVEISGNSYSEIIAGLVRRCFKQIDRPLTPQPPNILFASLPEKTGDDKKMKFLYSDAISYSEAIERVIEESGVDIETRYSAVLDGNKVKWQFTCGSQSNPHINESESITVQLRDADNIRKVSAFENMVDSTELFNSFYISSKQGDEEKKSGMDLKNAVKYSSDFPILLETYYSPGVELTESQLDSQLSSYISQGMNPKRTGSVTIELESENFVTWAHSYLGRTVTFVGYDNTPSAGYSVTLRIVGIRFELSSGRILVDIMSKMPRYPKLPRKKGSKSKKKNDPKKTTPSNKLVKAKDVSKFAGSGGGGGGLPPTPPWEGGGAYPPSEAGPGGQWGTGSETIKDDDSPYEITNYGKKWVPSGVGTGSALQLILSGTQNLSNVVYSSSIIAGTNFFWPNTWEAGLQSVSNAKTSASSSTPATPNSMSCGSGYLSGGNLVSWQADRFNFSLDRLIDDILMSKESWGFIFPSYNSNGEIYSHIGQLSLGAMTNFIVRDKLFFAITVNITARYKTSAGASSNTTISKSGIVFFSRIIRSWDTIDDIVFHKNATILNLAPVRAKRVGDFGLIPTLNGVYINNFSNVNAIQENNWYIIPAPGVIDGINFGSGYQNTFKVGSIIINGVRKRFATVTVGGNVAGIELLGGYQPIPTEGAVWQNLSSYFPVPQSQTNRTFSVDSVSGFYIYRIGGGGSTGIIEEVYFQNDNGSWVKLVQTGNVSGLSQIVFQYKEWLYYSYNASFVTYDSAFQLQKAPDWANPPVSTGSTASTARSVSQEELRSIDNMISEGGKA